GGGVIPDIVLDRSRASDRMIQSWLRLPAAFLEVGDEHIVALTNAQEVIHVAIVAVDFAASLAEKRNRVVETTHAGRGHDARARALESDFDGEGREPEARRRAERDVVVETVELERVLLLREGRGHADRPRGRGHRRHA